MSARAANAAMPAGSAYTGRIRDGISQGRLPTASTPSAAAPARTRCQAGSLPGARLPGACLPGARLPGARLPGGRRPGEDRGGQDDQRGDRHRGETPDDGGQQRQPQPPGAAPGRHGARGDRAERPGQAGVTEQQRPLADDEPLGHERVPGIEHPGGQPREPRLAAEQRRRARAGQHEDRQQQHFLHQVGRQHPGGHRHHGVAGHRPGRATGQPRQRGGERLPGHDHHVVAEQEPAPQPRAQGQRTQGQPGQGARPVRPRPSGQLRARGPAFRAHKLMIVGHPSGVYGQLRQ